MFELVNVLRFGMIILLLQICYQDFRTRQMSVLIWGIFCFVAMAYAVQQSVWSVLWRQGLVNMGFVTLQLGLVSLYFSWKHRRWVNISKEQLGLGDIIFFLPLCWLFTPFHFILFYLFSLLLVLLGFLIYNALATQKVQTIPLAGGQAICLIVVLLFIQ